MSARESVRLILRTLSIMERGVLVRRFGLDGKGPRDRETVAREFDLTVGQVHEMEERAITLARRRHRGPPR